MILKTKVIRDVQAGECDDVMLAEVLAAIHTHVSGLSGSALCRLAWALGTLGCYDTDMMVAISSAVLPHVPSLGGRSLGSLMWSLGKLSHPEPALTDAILARVIANSRLLPPREVALVLQGLVGTGHSASPEVLPFVLQHRECKNRINSRN